MIASRSVVEVSAVLLSLSESTVILEVSEIVPVPVVTGPTRLIPPAPVWSNVIEPAPDGVSEVTETAVLDVLLTSIDPAVESAAIDAAARLSPVELPMPVAAFRSMVLAVMRPAPLMEPAAVMVAVSPEAVVEPVRMMFPEVVVRRLRVLEVPAAVRAEAMERFAPVTSRSTLPSVVATDEKEAEPPPV